jgi:transcriptional regulator with PAS, ATPase and Fis domain
MKAAAKSILDGDISYHVATKTFQLAMVREAMERTKQNARAAGNLLGITNTYVADLLRDFDGARNGANKA